MKKVLAFLPFTGVKPVEATTPKCGLRDAQPETTAVPKSISIIAPSMEPFVCTLYTKLTLSQGTNELFKLLSSQYFANLVIQS